MSIEQMPIAPALFMSVRFEKPGNTARLTRGEKELVLRQASIEGINTELLKATKTLWESPEFDAICGFDKETTSMITRCTLPATRMFRAGFKRIPVNSVASWQIRLRELKNYRDILVSNFCTVYGDALRSAQAELGPLFRVDQYLKETQLASQFSMTWCFFQVCLPPELEQSSKRANEAAKELLETLTQETLAECRTALRSSFYQLVKKAADRLGVGEDGKQRVFRNTLTSNMQEFLAIFDSQNSIVGDLDLKILVEKAKAVFAEVPDAEKLRTDVALRDQVQRTMADVQATMESNMVEVLDGPNVDLE